MHKIDADIALEIASHEAVVRQTYKDSVGVLTWSVGLTNATGHRVNRYIGNPAPMSHCLAVFAWALERYADDVREAFGSTGLTREQFAAALSFHYNTGAIARASWVKKFKSGDVAGAKKSFMAWSKPKEIVPRRCKERDLFFSGKWSSDGRITEYTRVSSSMSPVWKSAKRIDVREDMRMALAQNDPAEAPAKPIPKPVQDVIDEADKPLTSSKQTWSGIAAGVIAPVLTVLENPIVQGIAVVSIIALVGFIIFERKRKQKQARAARVEAASDV